MTVFSTNIKKYRLQKQLTQEQVAEVLHVNPQTVSRWECGTTLPDVLILPEIARLYAITVDDLFRANNNAYRNYAERLATIYSKTKSVDDFYNAETEYRNMIKNGNMDIWDKWFYANLLDEMSEYCTEQALKWYDRVLEEGDKEDPYSYGRAKTLKAGLLIRLGKSEIVIKEQEEIVKKDPDNEKEVGFLMGFYCYGDSVEKVIELYEKVNKKEIHDWTIYYYAAEAYKRLKDFEKAIELYKKCEELGTDFHDEVEAMAICYERMGKKELAYSKFMEMASILKKRVMM